MPSDRDPATILDIVRAARLVLEFKAHLTKDEFLRDQKTQSAVLHQLLVIGEATRRLSLEFREQQSTIPWTLMSGMRNNLIHEYDDVDLDEVWKTATDDVPMLLTTLEPLLPSAEDNS